MTLLKCAEMQEAVILCQGTKTSRVKYLFPGTPRKLPDRHKTNTKMAELTAHNLLPHVIIPYLEFLSIAEVHSLDTSVIWSKLDIAVDEGVPN